MMSNNPELISPVMQKIDARLEKLESDKSNKSDKSDKSGKSDKKDGNVLIKF